LHNADVLRRGALQGARVDIDCSIDIAAFPRLASHTLY